MARPRSLDSLTLADYSDRELLHIVHEVAEESADGWAPSREIGKRVGLKEEAQARSVGSRLAALRSFGAVERDPQRKSLAYWNLTPFGQVHAFGVMSKQAQRAMEKASPEEMLMITRSLAEIQRESPDVIRHLMRREWFRSTTLVVNGGGRRNGGRRRR